MQMQQQLLGMQLSMESRKAKLIAEMTQEFMEEENNAGDHNMIRGNPNHTGVFQTYNPSRTVLR